MMMGSVSSAQANDLLEIIKDPQKYKTLLQDLATKTKSVEESFSTLDQNLSDYRVKLKELKDREEAVVSNDLVLKQSLKEVQQKLEDLKNRSTSLSDKEEAFKREYEKKSAQLANLSSELSTRESNLIDKEHRADKLLAEREQIHQASKASQSEMDAKLKQLKELWNG